MAKHTVGHAELPDEGPLTIPLWPDTGRILKLGRNATYDAANRGEIPVMRFGKSIRTLYRPLMRKLNGEG